MLISKRGLYDIPYLLGKFRIFFSVHGSHVYHLVEGHVERLMLLNDAGLFKALVSAVYGHWNDGHFSLGGQLETSVMEFSQFKVGSLGSGPFREYHHAESLLKVFNSLVYGLKGFPGVSSVDIDTADSVYPPSEVRYLLYLRLGYIAALKRNAAHEGKHVREALVIRDEYHRAVRRKVLSACDVYGPVPFLQDPSGPAVCHFLNELLFTFRVVVPPHIIYSLGVGVRPKDVLRQEQYIGDIRHDLHVLIIPHMHKKAKIKSVPKGTDLLQTVYIP